MCRHLPGQHQRNRATNRSLIHWNTHQPVCPSTWRPINLGMHQQGPPKVELPLVGRPGSSKGRFSPSVIALSYRPGEGALRGSPSMWPRCQSSALWCCSHKTELQCLLSCDIHQGFLSTAGGQQRNRWRVTDLMNSSRRRPWQRLTCGTTKGSGACGGVSGCPPLGRHKQGQTVALLLLRTILARPAQRKGWSINSCQITGRSGGLRALAEQEFSEGSGRSKT